jgi:cytochrome c oxidase subunit 3/cytochrome o ubiquinol oxidase subunit 3
MASELSHHGEHALDHAKVGMLAFLVTEVAFFSTLVVTYLFYLDEVRPTARVVFSMPVTIVSSICLLSSSLTIHQAIKLLERNELARFRAWFGGTILLGILFLVGTAFEWKEIIVDHGVTIATNMFGTAYFTVVGFHAAHVTIGVLLMSVFFGCAMAGRVTARQTKPAELISWYWHFVDAVWVVIFSVVYLAGR